MRALSLFSGVGGIDLGLERAGIRVVGQCEADEWRRAVLAERFPGVSCASDVTGFVPFGEPDLVAGGFPCQDVSVAGRRAGLAGNRTGLFWEFHRIIDTLRPRWVLLENVPGLLSSNHGRDFATIVDALDGIGYVGAWRILDSRWFGVPQRRRRVFILCADARVDPRAERCAEVLAVGTRCPRHPRTGGTPGESVAGALAGRSASRLDDACTGGGQLVAATLSSGGHPNSNMPGRRKEDDVNLVAFGHTQGLDHQASEHVTPTLRKQGGGGAVAYKREMFGESGVRRLTPRECERLQSFPDDWTLIPWNGKPSPDSRRYAALGDAVTVNVAHWIAARIVAADTKETP